jgi:hypothetical protein
LFEYHSLRRVGAQARGKNPVRGRGRATENNNAMRCFGSITHTTPLDEGLSVHAKKRKMGKLRPRLVFQDIVDRDQRVQGTKHSTTAGSNRKLWGNTSAALEVVLSTERTEGTLEICMCKNGVRRT